MVSMVIKINLTVDSGSAAHVLIHEYGHMIFQGFFFLILQNCGRL